MQIENYQTWEDNLKLSLEELNLELKGNENAAQLYNGFSVWGSNVFSHPKFLFIGINTGDGNPNNNKRVEEKPLTEMCYLEYVNGENDGFDLARETYEVFESLGFTEDEIRTIFKEECVKTNFYYIITKGQKDIKPCLDALGRDRWNDFWKMSYQWTLEVIEMVKPQFIICEGKSSFNEIKDMFEGIFGKEEISWTWEDYCGVVELKNEGLIVLGYERNYSLIKNKQGFAKLLKKYAYPEK